MPLKVLIIPDKFKGSLTAGAASETMARAWRKARPHDAIRVLPMSDGGDGFGGVVGALMKARPQRVQTFDAARRQRTAQWWWVARTRTAIIESAEVIGLALLPPGRFHPFQLDSSGLGTVIRAAVRRGARRCVIGIGGSATNDGGFGVARSLGWKFFDRSGTLLSEWTELTRLWRIEPPDDMLRFNVTVAVDVRNPLLGPRGATRTYGPQKGLKPSDFGAAEAALRRLVKVCADSARVPAVLVRRSRGATLLPGAGAAGGLGFGLRTFLSARLEPGFQFFARAARLRNQVRWADLVITGEGRVDRSTLMGKGVGELARLCRRSNRDCMVFAGSVSDRAEVESAFASVCALTDVTSAASAIRNPGRWLERLIIESLKA